MPYLVILSSATEHIHTTTEVHLFFFLLFLFLYGLLGISASTAGSSSAATAAHLNILKLVHTTGKQLIDVALAYLLQQRLQSGGVHLLTGCCDHCCNLIR